MMKTVLTLLLLVLFDISYAVVKGHHSSTCTADIEDISFGSYDPFDISVKRVPAVLTVRCSGKHPVSYAVKLLGGNSSDPTKRYLYSPSKNAKIYYNLYVNGSCIFGDGTGGTCVISGTVQPKHHGGISEETHTVIGVIPPRQNVPAGSDYSDTLIIQVDY